MILAATGHRPEKLGGYGDDARHELEAFAVRTLATLRVQQVISGMALGWDQAVAEACLFLGVPFIAAVPFYGQDRRWPGSARERYLRLLGRAMRVEMLSAVEPASNGQAAKLLDARNRWMVDHAEQMLALWNGSLIGGTANCVAYAERRRKSVLNVWPLWELRAVLG